MNTHVITMLNPPQRSPPQSNACINKLKARMNRLHTGQNFEKKLK